jgi:hypothetical protein
LKTEGAQGIKLQIKRCKPEDLTMVCWIKLKTLQERAFSLIESFPNALKSALESLKTLASSLISANVP